MTLKIRILQSLRRLLITDADIDYSEKLMISSRCGFMCILHKKVLKVFNEHVLYIKHITFIVFIFIQG